MKGSVDMKRFDLIIVGAGPSGLSAAEPVYSFYFLFALPDLLFFGTGLFISFMSLFFINLSIS